MELKLGDHVKFPERSVNARGPGPIKTHGYIVVLTVHSVGIHSHNKTWCPQGGYKIGELNKQNVYFFNKETVEEANKKLVHGPGGTCDCPDYFNEQKVCSMNNGHPSNAISYHAERVNCMQEDIHRIKDDRNTRKNVIKQLEAEQNRRSK